MFLLWGIFGGPFVACVTYLYGGICIKSIEDRQFVIFLMCLPAALIAVFLVPWSGVPSSRLYLFQLYYFTGSCGFMKIL